jgi:hypothetical protein
MKFGNGYMHEAVKAAVSEAQIELARINAQLEHLESLRLKKEMLERFVKASRELLEYKPGFEKPNGLAHAALGHIGLDHLWEAIRVAMGIVKRPMTAGEVLNVLNEQQVFVDGVHKRETVRSAMVRKEDVFERTRRGLFVLKEWPEAIKRSRDGEAVPVE